MAERELSPGDWGFVASVALELGIKYFKLTGGEPLVRDDIVDIVGEISERGGVVSIVTNGSLLYKYAKELAENNIEHINVSLHSLNPKIFYEITHGRLEDVLRGIEEALNNGIRLKIDYVVLGMNYAEYKDIIEYASKYGIDVNIIELIPLGIDIKQYHRLHKPLDEIVKWLEERAVKSGRREFQSRPVYLLDTGIKVTVIRGFCNPEMCMSCTRIRMTPDGMIKTCLFRNDTIVDARKHILERNREGLIKDFIKANMLREPFFKPDSRCPVNVDDRYNG